jgi:3-oxoacyl-[acyl-carrier-protein] synthase II
MADCLLNAMSQAGVQPSDVSYVNANGAAEGDADRIETLAFKKAFGEHAPSLKISSTKGATGHLLGAAGGVRHGLSN